MTDQYPEHLPDGEVLKLTQENIAMVQRFIDMDAGELFGRAALFNTAPADYSSFILASRPAEEARSNQRTFHLRAIVEHEDDMRTLVDRIRRREPRAAVRVIRLRQNDLRHAFQYDPLDGVANKDIPISS